MSEREHGELTERIEDIERAVGLRPPKDVWSNGWDVYGHFWGDWKDPCLREDGPTMSDDSPKILMTPERYQAPAKLLLGRMDGIMAGQIVYDALPWYRRLFRRRPVRRLGGISVGSFAEQERALGARRVDE